MYPPSSSSNPQHGIRTLTLFGLVCLLLMFHSSSFLSHVWIILGLILLLLQKKDVRLSGIMMLVYIGIFLVWFISFQVLHDHHLHRLSILKSSNFV
jgi:hypothetical protein